VVHVYGGPGVQRVKNEWAPLTVQLFAQNGIGVLELDNRGSSNRGRSFEAPIFRQMGEAEVHDQLIGAQFAQSLDWVDSERIGVFGHSYGGYMTLMCLAKAPEVFKAGVSVAPVTDWRLYDTHYTERYLSTPDDNPEGYLSSSVFPYLDALQGKLLIIHGMADDNVLFTNATKLFKALQQRNIAFEMMTYPGAKHGLQERDVSIHRFTLILDFFQRNLADN
jgi:dipeptidyl-peptidase-4